MTTLAINLPDHLARYAAERNDENPLWLETLVRRAAEPAVSEPAAAPALSKEERYRREVELINRNADRLNKEALDVLSYQACGWGLAGESAHEAG